MRERDCSPAGGKEVWQRTGEGVCGVGDQHAGLAHVAIAHHHALDVAPLQVCHRGSAARRPHRQFQPRNGREYGREVPWLQRLKLGSWGYEGQNDDGATGDHRASGGGGENDAVNGGLTGRIPG